MFHAVVKSSQPYDIGRQKTIEQYASSHAEVEREEEEERLSDESDVHVRWDFLTCNLLSIHHCFVSIYAEND
jgi:hypothetical protein